MKTLFSIILSLFIAGGGILFAMNVPQQDDPICSTDGHKGYELTGTPPATFDPDAPMPAGVTYKGTYGTANNFICSENELNRCHWAYIPADEDNPTAKWVECSGNFVELRPVE